MAIPEIDWDEWSQPAIEPFMEAVIHFPTEDVLLSDDEISSINFNIAMFDNSHVLFGPPTPATASLDIIDYSQRYNPMKDSTLVDNLQVDLYLGLRPLNREPSLGPNIVDSFEQPILVRYLDEEIWACIIHINETYLIPGAKYRITYTFTLEDEGLEAKEWFDVNSDWFERHIYAVTHKQYHTTQNVVIQLLRPLKQLYGVFFTQEWSHDTYSHITTVDMITETSDLLATDNRTSGLAPSTNVDLQTFILYLLRLYDDRLVNHLSSSDTVLLPYSFYEESIAKTLNSGIESLMASYIYAHDGIPHLFKQSWYNTGITLTDDDVESWEFAQSSIAVYDSVNVFAMIPSLKQETSLIFLENQNIVNGDTVYFNENRVFSLQTIKTSNDGDPAYNIDYSFDCLSITWNYTSLETYSTIEALGSTVDLSEQAYNNIIGKAPYELSKNAYIPSMAHAEVIYNYLNTYIFKDYFVITVSLRGCYGLWIGAQIHVTSDLYGIDGEYIITEIDFTYTGAVHTTLTLQRIN